jgi:diguanylate cyclase (GGDEF)-like protein
MSGALARKDDAMPQTILLIEGNSPSAAVVEQALIGSGDGRFDVERVRKCSEGQERLALDGGPSIAAVVTNLFLPDSRGLQTIARIFEASPHIPILVLTSPDHEDIAKEALRHGAQDYVLQHRLDSSLLPRVLQHMLYRCAHTQAALDSPGDAPNVEAAGHTTDFDPLVEAMTGWSIEEELGAALALRDIAQLQPTPPRMPHFANHDYLTELPNRRLLNDRLAQAIAHARRQQARLAILYVNIDRFKHINDSLGRAIGNQLLRSIGKRLMAGTRLTDTVSRAGGDEFVVLLTAVTHEKHVALSAKTILDAVAKPHCIETQDVRVTASIGICLYPDGAVDAQTLLQNAESAMLSTKHQGCNGYGFFKPHVNERDIERRFLKSGLRHALNHHDFVLHYEPKVDLSSGAMVGAEALIRWRRPARGVALAREFMTLAEGADYVIPMGLWALRKVCLQTRHWREASLVPLPIGIDISANELRSRDFVQCVRAILQDTGVDPRYLEIEITEIAVAKDIQSIVSILHALKDLGLQIALDHLGTGSSSLTYLKRVPVDALKIDSSLIRGLCTNTKHAGIVDAVISAGRSFHLRVVAEGIETREQVQALRSQRCSEGQGCYFRVPADASEFARLLETAAPPTATS